MIWNSGNEEVAMKTAMGFSVGDRVFNAGTTSMWKGLEGNVTNIRKSHDKRRIKGELIDVYWIRVMYDGVSEEHPHYILRQIKQDHFEEELFNV